MQHFNLVPSSIIYAWILSCGHMLVFLLCRWKICNLTIGFVMCSFLFTCSLFCLPECLFSFSAFSLFLSLYSCWTSGPHQALIDLNTNPAVSFFDYQWTPSWSIFWRISTMRLFVMLLLKFHVAVMLLLLPPRSKSVSTISSSSFPSPVDILGWPRRFLVSGYWSPEGIKFFSMQPWLIISSILHLWSSQVQNFQYLGFWTVACS